MTGAVSTASDAGLGVLDLLWLVGAVFLGSVVPVVPTGAAVSAAAALARQAPLEVAVVVLLAGAGAWAGDLVTVALARAGARGPLRRVVGRLRADSELVRRRERALARHSLRVLVIGRVVPAARIPTLVAAGAADIPARRLAGRDALACLCWALLYTAIGVAGRSVFGSPAVAVGVVSGVVLAVSVLGSQLARRRRHNSAVGRRGTRPQTGERRRADG